MSLLSTDTQQTRGVFYNGGFSASTGYHTTELKVAGLRLLEGMDSKAPPRGRRRATFLMAKSALSYVQPYG